MLRSLKKFWKVTLDTSEDQKYNALERAVVEDPRQFTDLRLDEEKGMSYKFIPGTGFDKTIDSQWKIYVPD
jgi:hypothetical protein